ncbi:hypothetical protein DIPPA_28911 [Diplonema papillatum]|nr:hypothetical protein DIPPA_28911 [Diplonema papillatum]
MKTGSALLSTTARVVVELLLFSCRLRRFVENAIVADRPTMRCGDDKARNTRCTGYPSKERVKDPKPDAASCLTLKASSSRCPTR